MQTVIFLDEKCVCMSNNNWPWTDDIAPQSNRKKGEEKMEQKVSRERFAYTGQCNAALTTFIGFHWSSRSGRFHLSWFDNHRNRLNWQASRSYGSVALLIRLKVVYLGGPDQFWLLAQKHQSCLKREKSPCGMQLSFASWLWSLDSLN